LDYFISLDIGTTSVKVALISQRGDVTSISTREYSLLTPSEKIVELDPQIYWQCCKEGIAEVLEKSGVKASQIKSVGVCSQGETLIVLDKAANPLRNAIVWMDNRSDKEAEQIRSAFGAENNTGQTDVAPTWPITKILWLKKNEPETYAKIRKFMLVEDFILYQLTGQFKGEYSLYSSSYMLDVVNKKWWDEILDYVGVDKELLVDLSEPGEIIGQITRSVCDQTGLDIDTKVVTGAMDQVAAMVGAGNIESGIVTETTGAALAVCGTVDSFPAKRSRSIAVQYHAIPDKYVLIGWCPTGGMALKWLRDTCFEAEKKQAMQANNDVYDYMTGLAKNVPIGSQDLIFLPYLAGPGTAEINSDASGVFYGLGLHHTRAHFVRSVMESIGFVLHQNILEMEKLGLKCTEVRSMGGGSKSNIWNQVKADILSKPIVTMKCSEAASVGIAILQARAIGTYKSLQEATNNMAQTAFILEPNERNHQLYKPIWEKFLEVNKACFGLK
jgi:sugar (pentulose or hexulose) kinase